MLGLQIILVAIFSCTLAAKLDVVYEWKYIDYLWNSIWQKSNAIASNRYDFTKIFTIDVEKVLDGRVFVTTPAFNPGAVPATLSTVSQEKGPGGPLLRPYPNWDWHKPGDCNGIISVWRVAVDECNRLWVLDSGKIGDAQVCEAQILVFDLWTDRLQQRIRIPNSVSHSPTNSTLGLLVTIVLETEGPNCRQTWAYLADTEGAGLVVCDGSKTWRINNDVFNPDLAAADLTIAGESFNLPDGLFGLAVSAVTPVGTRSLIFRPFASYKEYSFTTADLHKSSSYYYRNPSYTTARYRLPSQVAAQAFSRDGILFFGLTEQIAIACWNQYTTLIDDNVAIVAQDRETLQFASGVKVSTGPRNQEQLWVMTNRFQKIANDNQNFQEVNYRILTASVDSLVEGSKCKSRRY